MQKDYGLKEIPENIIINDLIDFSEINADGSLSVPIINSDQQTNEIYCSLKQIKCPIGPIFNLYLEPYKINILNFSNCTLLLKLSNQDQKDNNVDWRWGIKVI